MKAPQIDAPVQCPMDLSDGTSRRPKYGQSTQSTEWQKDQRTTRGKWKKKEENEENEEEEEEEKEEEEVKKEEEDRRFSKWKRHEEK